jgi:glutamate---cysteine ligase / carboxylate-amine ligase
MSGKVAPSHDTARAAESVGATLGVEEEFHILDPSTGELAAGVSSILDAERGGAPSQPELALSAVETSTPVCRDLAELRSQLLSRRSGLRDAAEHAGLWVAAVGTVPDAGATVVGVYPQARYLRMAHDYQQLVAEQQVCACQVQVGVPSRELAVALSARVRVWLPVLLALSASSPFFRGGDSGYASYRTVVWSRWPTAGPPNTFTDAAEYDATVRALIDSGTISDPGMVYFDVRPSQTYPTLEIRVADACPVVDDAVLLAALGRALVITAAREEAAGSPPPRVRHELLRAAAWRAARSGMAGALVDPVSAAPVPAMAMLDRLLTHLRPALDERDEWQVVGDLLAAHRDRRTSAERQRGVFARRGRLRDVVESVVAETALGS